ncbi:MAG: DNA polymerase III subunit gamma/tau [Candidatus Cryptobacteroides sp.]
MSDYIVSARKYRPDSFASLVGQDNIARMLKNSIRRGTLAHAYLFCGPRGVGKTSAARIFAKTINCSNPGADLEPCGECESCRSFAEGRSYCIHELDAASNNGIEDIKTLIDQVQIPPQTGRYSVFIIDEVHMLSQAAFNAFLKTLEEPPAHAIFILATTEKHKILPTIMSRCQTYDFNRISIKDIVSNLSYIAEKEGIRVDEESLHIIALKADGAMRDALTIFDQTVAFCGDDIKAEDVRRNLNVLDYEYCFSLVDSFLAGDWAAALSIFDAVLSKGFNAQYFISALGSHLRDLLVCSSSSLEALVDYPASLASRYAGQASRCSVKFLYDALSVCSQCEAQYRTSVNQRLHVEYCLMKMAFLVKAPSSTPAVQGAPAAPASTSPAPAPAAASASAPEAPVAANPAPAVTSAPAAPAPAAAPVVPSAAPKDAPEPSAASSQAAPSAPSPAASTQAPGSPAAAASPAPRARKSASSLSLSSLMSDDEPSIEPVPQNEAAAAPAEALSEEKLRESWSALASKQGTMPRLANALASASLEFDFDAPKPVVRFSVTNEAQKKWIEERILRNLEADYCALCKAPVRLEVFVSPQEEQKDLKYMPSEKAEDLMRQNENVKDLVKELNLDIK